LRQIDAEIGAGRTARPELWYRMPTYTNRNAFGLADPEQDIVWPSYTEKLDFERGGYLVNVWKPWHRG
jgi:hypothetical protein